MSVINQKLETSLLSASNFPSPRLILAHSLALDIPLVAAGPPSPFILLSEHPVDRRYDGVLPAEGKRDLLEREAVGLDHEKLDEDPLYDNEGHVDDEVIRLEGEGKVNTVVRT